MKQDNNIYEDEVNIKPLLLFYWKKKALIILITSFFAVISVIYAISLPNIYTSSALLAPANQSKSLNPELNQISSFTSLGGITIPRGANTSRTNEAVERIKSYEFFSKYFLPNTSLENIVAVDRWNARENEIIYKEKIYNKSNGEWPKGKYSEQQAFKFYKKSLSVNIDIKTGFVNISIEHKSPIIAKGWLDTIIYNINESMRLIDIKLTKSYIEFLNSSQKSTNIQSLKDVSSSLLESQMQTLMLASSSQAYIFKILNSPIIPELKSKPNRAIICIAITLFGGMLSLFIVTIKYINRDSQIDL